MTQRIAQLIQLLMMVSLLAMPSYVMACPVAKNSPTVASCCGSSCSCPAAKACTMVPSAPVERAISQAQPETSYRAPVLLCSLNFERNFFPRKSFSVATRNVAPPSLVLGSPPQSRLRVWLL